MDLRHEGQVEVNKSVKEEEQEADEYFKQLESEMNENQFIKILGTKKLVPIDYFYVKL